MIDLVEKLREKYPRVFPVYVKNQDIIDFLNENKEQIEMEDFQKLKDFYADQNFNRQRVFQAWETENKQILAYKAERKKENKDYPQSKEFKDLLELRRYSRKTIKAYSSALLVTNEYMKKTEKVLISEANREQFQNYFQYLTKEKKVSDSTIRIARFAIEYYRNEVVLQPIRLDFAFGLRKKDHLPTIFSKTEIIKILNATNNLKHKLMLSLLYSAGLRLSEVIHLKVGDIDLEQKTIRVREGKGGKDRITVLSEKLISDIRIFTDGKEDNQILFPSNQPKEVGKESYLSLRSVEHVFASALKKSGVRKHGTPHDLRHSFATHLLETGTDIRFIQKLLGHQNVSTTTIYTKLANPRIAGVQSPF